MYNPTLEPSRIRASASLRDRVVVRNDGDLNASDSAFYALTDFELDFPITVDIERTIGEAFRDMNRLGIHALLVTRQGLRGIDPQIFGLITAHDIERAQARHPRNGAGMPARRCLKVCEVMTLWEDLSYVKYESLRSLTAMDLYQMFQGTGLTHLLVVQLHEDEVPVARGVLSRAALGKRLQHARQTVHSVCMR
jgi:CBS domain-containing protein